MNVSDRMFGAFSRLLKMGQAQMLHLVHAEMGVFLDGGSMLEVDSTGSHAVIMWLSHKGDHTLRIVIYEDPDNEVALEIWLSPPDENIEVPDKLIRVKKSIYLDKKPKINSLLLEYLKS